MTAAPSAPAWLPELSALVEAMTGRPFADLPWQELVAVRDQVDAVLNGALNRRQAPRPAGGDAA